PVLLAAVVQGFVRSQSVAGCQATLAEHAVTANGVITPSAAPYEMSVIDSQTDKSADIDRRKVDLPLPEQPSAASDLKSANMKTTGTGSGAVSGISPNESESGLRGPATAKSSTPLHNEPFQFPLLRSPYRRKKLVLLKGTRAAPNSPFLRKPSHAGPVSRKPKGAKLTEGGFDEGDQEHNTSFTSEIGSEDDPGRLTERRYEGRNAETPGEAAAPVDRPPNELRGGRGQPKGGQLYGVLEPEEEA
ncbi:hypothetical protein ACJ73_06480, partial [Blastomyces percursus]